MPYRFWQYAPPGFKQREEIKRRRNQLLPFLEGETETEEPYNVSPSSAFLPKLALTPGGSRIMTQAPETTWEEEEVQALAMRPEITQRLPFGTSPSDVLYGEFPLKTALKQAGKGVVSGFQRGLAKTGLPMPGSVKERARAYAEANPPEGVIGGLAAGVGESLAFPVLTKEEQKSPLMALGMMPAGGVTRGFEQAIQQASPWLRAVGKPPAPFSQKLGFAAGKGMGKASKTNPDYYTQMWIAKEGVAPGKPSFEKVQGTPVKIQGFEDYDFFVHRTGGPKSSWVVSEGRTGASATQGNATKSGAISEATVRLNQAGKDEVKKFIDTAITAYGESPRYAIPKQQVELAMQETEIKLAAEAKAKATVPLPGQAPLEQAGKEVKQPWEMTRGEYENWYSNTLGGKDILDHKIRVGRALQEGKPVPPEVLAEYPDLAAKAKPASKVVGGVPTPEEIQWRFPTANDFYDWARRNNINEEQIDELWNKANKAKTKLQGKKPPAAENATAIPTPVPAPEPIPPTRVAQGETAKPPVEVKPTPAAAPQTGAGEIPPVEPPPVTETPLTKEIQPKQTMASIIRRAQGQVDLKRQGKIAKVESLTPETGEEGSINFNELGKRVRSIEEPGLKMTGKNEKVLTAAVAEQDARNYMASMMFPSRQVVINDLKSAFGKDIVRGKEKSTVQFLGTTQQARNPITGTLKDIVENPELYSLSDTQKAVITRLGQHNDTFLDDVVNEFGAEIGRLEVKPGAAYLATVDVGEDVLQIVGSDTRAIARGRGKERLWQTARERVDDAIAKNKKFTPELDVQKLIEGSDNFKASAAGGQSYREVIGGLNRAEVIAETHPALFKKMTFLKKRLSSLQGSVKTVETNLHDEIAKFLASPLEGQDLAALQSALDVKLKSGIRAGYNNAALQKEIDGIRQQIKALKPFWENANPKPYALVQEGIYRYFPADQAKLILEQRRTTDNPLLNAMANVKAGAFGGDISPIGGVQMPLGALFNPIGSVPMAKGGLQAIWKDKDLLRGFKMDALARDMTKDPEEWSRFFSLMGYAPKGTPAEFAGGYMRKLPGFAQFNDANYVMVTRASRNMWKQQTATLMKRGLTQEQAEIVAVDLISKIYPMNKPSLLGQSQRLHAVFNSIPTSYSFIRKPIEMLDLTGKGLTNIVLRRPVTPQQRLAIELSLTAAASTMAVSASSAAISAQVKGRDVKKAALDAINPDPSNGNFASIIIGDKRFPIAGPYRALFRAIYPADVPGVPIPLPFAGIGRYIGNRMTPLVRSQIDLIKNEDYSGRQIIKGDSIQERIIRALEYEAESMVPLTLGTVAQGIRVGAEPGYIAEQAASQFAGANLSENKSDQLQSLAEQKGLLKPGEKLDELLPSVIADLKRTPEGKTIMERGGATAQTPVQQVLDRTYQILAERDRWLDAKKDLDGNVYTAKQWKKDYYDIQAERFGAKEMRDSLKGIFKSKPKNDNELALNKYIELIKKHEKDAIAKHPQFPDMTRNELTAMIDAMEDWRNQFTTPTQEEYILDAMGANDTPKGREFRAAKRKIEPYWDYQNSLKKHPRLEKYWELKEEAAQLRASGDLGKASQYDKYLASSDKIVQDMLKAWLIKNPEIDELLYKWAYASRVYAPENMKKYYQQQQSPVLSGTR